MFNNAYQTRHFEGVVESRLDPLQIGRVQVRVFGIHTDNLQLLPTEDLHWFNVSMPPNSASTSGVGSMHNLVEGSHVWGFFLDGDNCQNGIVVGSINGIPQTANNPNKGFNDTRKNLSPSIVPGSPTSVEIINGILTVKEDVRKNYPQILDVPDISPLGTGQNIDSNHTIKTKKATRASQVNINVANGGTFSEPNLAFAAKYPYNDAKTTESGHSFEMDDTPSAERISLAHRVGSFIEMRKDGDIVNKSTKDTYDIIHGASYEHTGATKTITIEKGMKVLVNNSNGSEGIEIQIGSGGNINIVVSNGNVTLDVKGDMKTSVQGDYVVEALGRIKLSGSTIDFN